MYMPAAVLGLWGNTIKLRFHSCGMRNAGCLSSSKFVKERQSSKLTLWYSHIRSWINPLVAFAFLLYSNIWKYHSFSIFAFRIMHAES